MKNLYKINLIIFLTFLLSVIYLLANSNGKSGQTDAGCTCHGSSSSNTKVSLAAANGFAVEPGSTNGFTVTVETTSGKSKAGIDIAVKTSSSGGSNAGTLSAGSDLKTSSGELVHANNGKSFSGGKTTFSFDWKAPSTPGVYYIKAVANAVDGNNKTGNDEWNKISPTQVTVKGLTLTSLKGGQELCAGGSTNITWDVFGVDNVKIELSTNGGSSFDQVITQSTPASSKSYSWTIPTQLSGNTLRIRISDAANANIKDQSGSNFTVAGPPQITNHPTSTNSCTGENISFSVSAVGSNLTYQWYKGSNQLSGKTQATLTINNATMNDAGDYKCEVSSECGNPVMSNVANLALTQAPSITDKSEDVTICEGENTTLSVTAIGDNISYQWYKENDIISGATQATYQISNATSNNSARYKVVVTSESCGEVTSPYIRVTVNKPVSITKNPKDTLLCESATLLLAVEATGSALQYEWFLNDVKIPNKFAPELTIEGFNESHVGQYKCRVYNSCGNVFSTIATANIKYKPVIISQSPDLVATEGSAVKFSIEAEGEDLTYEWYKNEVKISNQSGKDLIMNNVRAEDAGDYICRVSNECDFVDSKAIKLTITDPGPGGILSLSETAIDFGDIEVGKKKDLIFEEFFKNIGDDVLQVASVKIKSTGSVFTLKEIFSFTLEANETLELFMSFRPTEQKMYYDTLIVSQGLETDPILIPISGNGIVINKKAEITASTTKIDFGQVNIGEKSSMTLTLTNNTPENSATLTNITLNSEVFSYISAGNPFFQGTVQDYTVELEYIPIDKLLDEATIDFTFENADPISVDLVGSGRISSVSNYFESIELYPNPSTNGINIKFNSKEVEQYFISIVDLNGNEIYNFGNVYLNSGINNLNWNAIDANGIQVSKGYYNLIIRNKKIMVVEKIIVK